MERVYPGNPEEQVDTSEPWFCPTCNAQVPWFHVTYEETHDPRSGGCGQPVE